MEFHPNRKINENRLVPKDLKTVHIKQIVDRYRIIKGYFSHLDGLERSLFFHKYPRLSQAWKYGIQIFCLFFDPKYALSYIVALIFITFSFGHPAVNKYSGPFLQMLFWDHPNKDYISPENIPIKRETDTAHQESLDNLIERNTPFHKKVTAREKAIEIAKEKLEAAKARRENRIDKIKGFFGGKDKPGGEEEDKDDNASDDSDEANCNVQ